MAGRAFPRRIAVIALCVALVPVMLVAGFALFMASLPALDMTRLKERSAIVVDRQGKLLRPFVMADGRWRMPVRASEVDPQFLAMLIAYEDKRFYSHIGVDPVAMLRAAWQGLIAGRIVSGGSTLSMQVARLTEPRSERSLAAKLRQMARAVELDRRLGKAGILDLYLALAPYGGNIEGLRTASLAYFGREPNRLSSAEAALLVALPQAPEQRRPDRSPARALAARTRVLERVAKSGTLNAADLVHATDQPLPEARRPFPHHAAHYAEALVAAEPATRRFETSLARDWQSTLERLAMERAEALGPKLSVAIVVIETATGELRASIGGADYFDAARAGGIDLARAIRSPGSALKPFIYALAFENGIAHPETMLEDRQQRFGAYAPENFEQGFSGLVSARTALQQSLNLPAVELLSALGPQRFISRLRQGGAQIEMRAGEAPGLAVALGGLGITLHDLTTLYASLARGTLTDPVSAWYVGDILTGAPPPDNGPTGRIAFKTGTSYGYRDAFAVGFDKKHTIGVWVGRADNAAVPGLIGRKAAAPILFDAFSRIGLEPGISPRPREALMASARTLPPPLRHLRQDIAKTASASMNQALQIAYPPDGAVIDARASAVDGKPWLVVKLNGGAPPFTFLVNGAPIRQEYAAPSTRRMLGFAPEGQGFSEIAVIDAKGASARVNIRMQ